MPELSNYTTLSGSIRVFDGSLSKTQFEEIWDRIEERVNSDLMPEYAVVDDKLNKYSTNPVENKEVTAAIDRVYRVFPTITLENGNGYLQNTIVIYDGGAELPLENLVINFGPIQEGSGDPSSENVRPFTQITNLPEINHSYSTADDGPVALDILTIDMDEVSTTGIYAGYIDFKSGFLYTCRYYDSYAEEELVGPWISSMDVYSEESTPTIGAAVIDLGSFSESSRYFIRSWEWLETLKTSVGTNRYSIDLNGTPPCRSFSITYRADPDLYVVQAVGLTTEQKQALVALLDD